MTQIHMYYHTSCIYTRMFFVACFAFIGIISFGTASFTHAQEVANAATSSSPLLQTKTQLYELFKIQDDTSLPAYEKEVKEISLRRDILNDLITIARTQADDAHKRLNGISFDKKDAWESIQSSITSRITNATTYYSDVITRLATDTALTVTDLKTIAKELEQKKSDVIDPVLKEANTITALFHIGSLLNVADDRLHKIGADVEKIYAQKITTEPIIRALFSKASDSLKKSRSLYDSAGDMLVHLYNPNTASSTKYATDLYKTLVEKKVIATASSTATTTDLNTQTDTSISESEREALDIYVQKTMADTITHIKDAYGIFIQMSTKVKGYLQ